MSTSFPTLYTVLCGCSYMKEIYKCAVAKIRALEKQQTAVYRAQIIAASNLLIPLATFKPTCSPHQDAIAATGNLRFRSMRLIDCCRELSKFGQLTMASVKKAQPGRHA